MVRAMALMTQNLRHCRRCRSVVRHGLSSVLVCANSSGKRGHEPIRPAYGRKADPVLPRSARRAAVVGCLKRRGLRGGGVHQNHRLKQPLIVAEKDQRFLDNEIQSHRGQALLSDSKTTQDLDLLAWNP